MDQQKNGFNIDPAEFLKRSLDDLFAIQEERVVSQLKDFAQGQLKNGDHFYKSGLEVINHPVDSFVFDVRRRFPKARQALENRLENRRKTLAKDRDLLERLEEQRRKSIYHSVIPASSKSISFAYFFFYLALILSAMFTYASFFRLVFPVVSKWVAFSLSVILAAPSFFLARTYFEKSLERRDKLLGFLNRFGIWCSVVLLAFFNLSRALVSQIVSSSSSFTAQNLLKPASNVNILDLILTVSSSLVLLASLAVEIAFAGGVAIYATKLFERHKPKDLISQEIEELKKRVKASEAEVEELEELIERSILDEASLRAWAEGKKKALYLRLESVLAHVNEELDKKFFVLPTHIRQRLVAMGEEMGNGHPKGGNQNVKGVYNRPNSFESSEHIDKHIDGDGSKSI